MEYKWLYLTFFYFYFYHITCWEAFVLSFNSLIFFLRTSNLVFLSFISCVIFHFTVLGLRYCFRNISGKRFLYVIPIVQQLQIIIQIWCCEIMILSTYNASMLFFVMFLSIYNEMLCYQSFIILVNQASWLFDQRYLKCTNLIFLPCT